MPQGGAMKPLRLDVLSLATFIAVAALPTNAFGQSQYSLEDWLSVQRVRSFVVSPDGEDFFYTSGPAPRSPSG